MGVVYHVTIFGLKLKLDPVAFTLPIGGGWHVYWYGILIAIGFLGAIAYGFWRARKYNVDPDRLTDVILITTPRAILCARLYYIIFYKGDLGIDSISDFFGFTGSSGVAGLAIYGGVIGAVVIGFLACKIRKVNFLDALDLAACGFLIGQAVGRWGNFFNQEAFGGVTGSSWFGMTSEAVASELGTGVLAHPCFLYESIWCILGFVLLHILGNRRKFSGQLALTYGIWYGFGRMIIETFRTDSLYLGPLKVSQWLSGVLVIACIIIYAVKLHRMRQAKIDQTYTAMFDEVETFSVTTVSGAGAEDAQTLEQETAEESVETAEEGPVAAEKTVEESAETIEETAEKTVSETTEEAAEKTLEEVDEEAAEETAKRAAEKGGEKNAESAE